MAQDRRRSRRRGPILMDSCRPLPEIPAGSDTFVDANIFVYGLAGRSAQCRQFLERCSRDEITGITLFETVNEASHRFMLAEAKSKGLVQNESARELRKPGLISGLSAYWLQTERKVAQHGWQYPIRELAVGNYDFKVTNRNRQLINFQLPVNEDFQQGGSRI